MQHKTLFWIGISVIVITIVFSPVFYFVAVEKEKMALKSCSPESQEWLRECAKRQTLTRCKDTMIRLFCEDNPPTAAEKETE